MKKLKIGFIVLWSAFFLVGCGKDDNNTETVTDTTAPAVLSTTPSDDATGVSVSLNEVTIIFSEKMGTGSSKTHDGGGTGWTGNWSSDMKTYTISNISLTSGETVTITLNQGGNAGFADVAGNALGEYVFSFTAKLTTPPTSVDVTGTWSGTLSGTLSDGKSVNSSVIYVLTQSGSSVTGTYTDVNNDTGSISGALSGNTFTATVTTNQTHPDCANWDVTLTHTISGNTMTGSWNGTVCYDIQGGQSPTTFNDDVSANLTKQ